MDELYLKLDKLFNDFSSLINGKVLVNDLPRLAYVLKDDIVLEYNFGGRDDPSCFLFACPLDLEDIKFSIYPKNKIIISPDMDRYNEVKDYVVFKKYQGNTQKLMTALFNDFEFKDSLKNLGKWSIHYNNKVLIIMRKKQAFPLIGKDMNVEELMKAYELLIETKKALEYYIKKI